MSLDIRRGRSTGDIGLVTAEGDLGGILTTEALTCWTIFNDDSVGVRTGGARLLGDGESSTGDSGRTKFRAAGDPFLFPFKIESRRLLGVGFVVTIVGIGGVSRTSTLDNRFGVLKLGFGGE